MALNKRQLMMVAGVVLAIVFYAGFKYGQAVKQPIYAAEKGIIQLDNTRQQQEQASEAKEKPKIIVHIAGEVEHPGIYELAEGARVNDGVQMAKPSENANLQGLNLAQLLMDGQKLVVPHIDEQLNLAPLSDNFLTGASSTKVNINHASAQELAARLPGIGPVIGQRIVDYRQANGPFKTEGDIVKVSGIGNVTYENIKDLITVR